MDCFGNVPLNFTRGRSVGGIGLVVGGDADGTVGMVGAVIVVMERFCQRGKENEADEKK